MQYLVIKRIQNGHNQFIEAGTILNDEDMRPENCAAMVNQKVIKPIEDSRDTQSEAFLLQAIQDLKHELETLRKPKRGRPRKVKNGE